MPLREKTFRRRKSHFVILNLTVVAIFTKYGLEEKDIWKYDRHNDLRINDLNERPVEPRTILLCEFYLCVLYQMYMSTIDGIVIGKNSEILLPV